MLYLVGRKRALATLVATLIIAGALPPTSLAATAAQADADGSLCAALSVEPLNGVGDLEFATPMEISAGGGSTCVFRPADPSASYSLYTGMSEFSIDDLRASFSDASYVSVGDRPGLYANGTLYVGVGEGVLSVALDVPDAGNLGGLDVETYAAALAEVAVPVAVAMATMAPDEAGAVLAPPPEVAALSWGASREGTSAAEMMEAEGQAAVWQPLLDGTGAAPEDLHFLSVNAFDASSDEIIGNYDAFRIIGVDEGTFEAAVLDWLRALSGSSDVVLAELSLGGKDAVSLTVDGELRGYLYVSGDTAHSVTLSENVAAQVFEALP